MTFVAFNDHTFTTLHSFDVPLQTRPFEHSDVFQAAFLDDPRLIKRIEIKLKRSGLNEAAFLKRFGEIWERKSDIPN